MNITYIITILAVYILFMLMHKTEKKQNIISWLAISAILILCYNIFICLICTFLGVLCTLGNLSICNSIIIVILASILLKNKKIQKYYTKATDIIFSILLLILVIFVAYKQYGFPFNIKYCITDGSSHYFFAQQFYENSTLLYNEITDDILGLYNSNFRLPGAYVNEGILFKVFDGIISQKDLFILFDLFILYLSGVLFYQLLKTYSKGNIKLEILATVFSVIYMLGYQLNSMLWGYVYLSLALTIIIVFLLLMASWKKEEITDKTCLIILSLISLGMFFSYAYFIPIIYIAIIIDIIVKSKKNKEKIISNRNIIKLLYLILIPTVIGVFYFIIFPMANGIKSEISTIGVAGAIYENYITNYLITIPIFLTGIILAIKNKEKNYENYYQIILFTLSIIFAIILFIGYKFELVSRYYFFKAYYIIWLLAIYNVYIALGYILTSKYKKLKIVTYIYIGIYVATLIIATLILKKNIGINNVFYTNEQYINNNEAVILKGEEYDFVEKVENLEPKDDVYILNSAGVGKTRWMSVLYHNQYLYIDFITGMTCNIDGWIEEREEKYYFSYHNDYKDIEEQYELDEDSEKYKILYNNEYGFILERK